MEANNLLFIKLTVYYHAKSRKHVAVLNELWHGISNNMVCATSKASDQPAHTGSLIRAFSRLLHILGVFSY